MEERRPQAKVTSGSTHLRASQQSGPEQASQTVALEASLINVDTGALHVMHSSSRAMDAFTIEWLQLASSWEARCQSEGLTRESAVLRLALNGRVVGHMLLRSPGRLLLPRAANALSVDASAFPAVRVHSTHLALHVYLNSADGQPDQAMFALRPGEVPCWICSPLEFVIVFTISSSQSRTLQWVNYQDATAAKNNIEAFSL